jgi:hypothetical protein
VRTWLAAALIAASAMTLSSCGSAQPASKPAEAPASPTGTTSPVSAADTFYAVAQNDHGAIDAFSARSGKLVRRVSAAERDGMPVTGLARLSPSALLVTYSTGPQCTSNVNGCGPKPDTCGGEIASLNLDNGVIKVLWKVGPDQRLSAARPSPDGTKLTALTSPCVPSFFNDHLVVRRLSDAATWTIGSSVPRCHFLGAPQWTADSAHLVVSYAPPTGTTPYAGGDGTCTDNGDNHLVRVAADTAQPLISGTTVAAPSGCTYQAIASNGGDIYAVQACGPDQSRLQGPATLVRLGANLTVTQRWPIGECTDGNDIAAATQGVLLAAYLFCNPPLDGHALAEPLTVLDRVDGAVLKRIAVLPGGGTPLGSPTW